MVRPFLDGIFLEKNQFMVIVLPVALVCVTSLKGLLVCAQSYMMSSAANWVVSDIRKDLFSKVMMLPIRFHDGHSSSRLVARVLIDVGTMGNAIPSVMKSIVQQALTFLAMLGVAFYQNWYLANVILFLAPAAYYVASRIGNRLAPLATRSRRLTEEMTAVMGEAFSGIRMVKAYGDERQESARFQDKQHLLVRTGIQSDLVASLTSPLLELIGMVGIAGIVWYGGYQVINGAMTPGAFFSFLAALVLSYRPLRAMGGANNIVQNALASARRVFELLDQENERTLDRGTLVLRPLSQSLEYLDVSFRYDGRDEMALKAVSFAMRSGETIAIVGRSGSGKSTLAHLVIRFYDPTSGAILIDGRDIRHATLESLRRQIGVVAQDPILFDDTVLNNIAYGRLDASKSEVMAAAKSAEAAEFIEQLPLRYDTLIGERGVRLSGGQRQRIAIARAILRDPRLLILDEATSSLDSESEGLVQEALYRFMKTRTTLVIAHRLSTVLNAHRIVVLEKGQIVGLGRHQELLTTSPVYQRLYEAQFKDVHYATRPTSH
jgi:subfamily B ATP-binding cassette protein MsbA